MNNKILECIQTHIGTSIQSWKSVPGGDISQAFMVESTDDHFFVKINSDSFAPNMFRTERLGLEAIRNTEVIKAPEVILVDQVDKTAFIVMEYVSSKTPMKHSSAILGRQLAAMHQCTQSQFGWSEDNYIGRLNQSNKAHSDWTSFYVSERLIPQLNKARADELLKSKECPAKDRITEVCSEYFRDISPSLIHGDLWSENYLVAEDGPYLIDPAVYYGHGEVDLAMSRLFGGFDSTFYEAYHEILPITPGYQERIGIYQLYYLLVHLNLFGSTYFGPVMRIMRKYFL